MALTEFSPTDLLLLEASRVSLTDEQQLKVQLLIPQVTDWENFVQRAMATHLAPLLFRSLSTFRGQGVPDEALATLQRSYNTVLSTNIRMYALFSEIAEAWHQAGIEVIPLKGIYLAESVYGDIGLRHLSDMDLLVREGTVERCAEVAHKHGWEVKWFLQQTEEFTRDFGSAHPVKFIKAGAVIELHTHIHNRGKSYRVDIEEYWKNSSPAKLSGHTIRTLRNSDLIQHLCIHLYKHMASTELKISSFCDIREVLGTGLSQEEWEILRASSALYNAWNEVQTVLYLCGEFWGVAVPSYLLNDFRSEQKAQVSKLFLHYFTAGGIVGTEKLHRLLSITLKNVGQADGVQGKAQYLRSFLFPTGEYLRQRYRMNGITLLLRVYHPSRLLVKGAAASVLRLFR
jgi:hypothetical protein